MISELRTQVRDMKRDIERKDETIQSLRKNMKVSKQNEIEVELEAYRTEVNRLK